MDIGQASRASGISHRMNRHHEDIGLIPPAVRTGSGYRVHADQVAGLDRRIAVLTAMRRALGELDAARQGDREPRCPILGGLAMARPAEGAQGAVAPRTKPHDPLRSLRRSTDRGASP